MTATTTYFTRHATTRAAILVYARHMADPLFEREPTPAELRLIVEHCYDYIHAPALVFPRELIAHLREQVIHIRLPHELTNWLEGCRTIGVYPLGFGALPLGVERSNENTKRQTPKGLEQLL